MLSGLAADQEVKKDPPPPSSQHAYITLSDEKEATEGVENDLKDGSCDGRADSINTSTTTSSLQSKIETSTEEDGYPSPPQLSLMSSVHSVVSQVQDYIHHMPRWQYRFMLASILLLFLALIMVVISSVLYGFNMHHPHVQVVDVQLLYPFPFADASGNIPVTSSMLFSNRNSFPAITKPTDIYIYALPSRSPASILGITSMPSFEMAAHEQRRALNSTFNIRDIGSVDGGQSLVQAVLQGENNFMYATSVGDITVKVLGLISISRSYKNECTVLKKWGADSFTMSDCYGHFA